MINLLFYYLSRSQKRLFFSVFRKTTYFFTIVSPLAMEINDSWIVLESIFFIVSGQGGLFVGCSLTLLFFSALIMLVSKYNLFYFRQVNPDEVFSLLKFWILYCLLNTDYELKTLKNTKEHFVSVLLLDHCFLNVKRVYPLLLK